MDTIVAPITPVVNAPIIVLRVSGDRALDTFNFIRTKSGSKIALVRPNYAYYCEFITNDGLTDDIIAIYFKAPHSFTGDDVVELSFHGNPTLIAAALGTLYTIGIRDAKAGEFSKNAFLNGKIGLTQAEAIQELIAAKSEQGLVYAINQFKGSVANEFSNVKGMLLELKAIVEAKIDFPDDDTTDDVVAKVLADGNELLAKLNRLLVSYQALRTQREGVNLVLAGKPNVGKSSLLNALLKMDRAIVSDKPGTTRDYIKERLLIGNLPVTLFDTAGIRSSGDDIEQVGVERSKERISSADIVLLVIDLSGALDADDAKMIEMTDGYNRIIIGNKSDEYKAKNFVPADIIVSAKLNHNIDKLIDMITERLRLEDSEKYSNIVVVTERHAYLIAKVIETLKLMLENISDKNLDMLAFDIESSISNIEELTGERYTEDVLDIIFSKFCIGK